MDAAHSDMDHMLMWILFPIILSETILIYASSSSNSETIHVGEENIETYSRLHKRQAEDFDNEGSGGNKTGERPGNRGGGGRRPPGNGNPWCNTGSGRKRGRGPPTSGNGTVKLTGDSGVETRATHKGHGRNWKNRGMCKGGSNATTTSTTVAPTG